MSAMNVPVESTGKRTRRRRRHEGIELRHQRSCTSRAGEGCSCTPSYQAQVWSPRDRKPIRKTFPSLAQARAWRQESQVALRKGSLRAASPITLNEAAEEWFSAASAGLVRTRFGDPYKPSAVRAYRQALDHRVLPSLGQKRLSAISHNMLQDLADHLQVKGLSASSIRNTILPLRAIYRRATQRGELALNPTLKLSLPAVRGRRDRIACPQEAAALIQALPLSERALWATAVYAGLRMGELQALQWQEIDLEQNLIHIERSWDRCAGFIEPKSRAGKRRVPITPTLRTHLINHRLQQGTGGSGFVFPNNHGDRPFNPTTSNGRAKTAWSNTDLRPISLHECRHTYAAYMIAADINPKALSTYMGHTSITITLDRYGHLLPGNEQQAATLLHTWLTTNTATATSPRCIEDARQATAFHQIAKELESTGSNVRFKNYSNSASEVSAAISTAEQPDGRRSPPEPGSRRESRPNVSSRIPMSPRLATKSKGRSTSPY
jgi:integrase